MKFGLCNEMFVNAPVREAIRCAAKLGYDGVELAPFTLGDPTSLSARAQREIARCAADHGIEILGLHWLLPVPKGLHVTTPDPAVWRRTRDFFHTLIEIAANTGGRILTLGSPSQRNIGSAEDNEGAVQRLIERLREVAPAFEARGLVLALEPLEPALTNFLTRTAEARRIADAVNSPAVGITLDTHFLRWECAAHSESCLDLFRRAGHRLAHLHVQDDNFRAPGTGTADFDAYAAAVRAIGWRGYVCFETLDVQEEGLGEALAADCIRFLKDLFAPEGAPHAG